MERTKKLYLLTGILIFLCAVTFLTASCDEKKEEIQNSDEIILQLETESITEISWDYKNEMFEFQKDETWVYVKDENFPVDSEVMEHTLSLFEEFGAAFIIENVEDYGQYGLSSPSCTINVTADGDTYEVLLGDYSAMDSKRYVSIGDGNVYLVTEDPLDYLAVSLSDMIDHDNIPEMDNVKEIRFAGIENYEIVYDEENNSSLFEDDIYFTEQNGSWKALSSDNVSSYLDTVRYLNLTEYVTYDAGENELEKYGLNDPELSLSVIYEGEDSEDTFFQLHISRDPQQRESTDEEEDITAYVRVGESDIIYEITSSEYKELMAASYNELRRQEILPVEFVDVEAMVIELEGEEFTLTSKEKSGETVWYYDEDEMDITALESALAYMEASEFTSEEPQQKEEISLLLQINMDEVSEIEIIFYRYDGEKCLAVIDGISTALVARSEVVDLIEAVNAVVLN